MSFPLGLPWSQAQNGVARYEMSYPSEWFTLPYYIQRACNIPLSTRTTSRTPSNKDSPPAARHTRSPSRPECDYALLPLAAFGPPAGAPFLAAALWARAAKPVLPVSPPAFAWVDCIRDASEPDVLLLAPPPVARDPFAGMLN